MEGATRAAHRPPCPPAPGRRLTVPQQGPRRARIAFFDSAAGQLENITSEVEIHALDRPGRRLRRPRLRRADPRRHRRPSSAPVHRRHRAGARPVLRHRAAHRGRRRIPRGLTREEAPAPSLVQELSGPRKLGGLRTVVECPFKATRAPRRPGARRRNGRGLARVPVLRAHRGPVADTDRRSGGVRRRVVRRPGPSRPRAARPGRKEQAADEDRRRTRRRRRRRGRLHRPRQVRPPPHCGRGPPALAGDLAWPGVHARPGRLHRPPCPVRPLPPVHRCPARPPSNSSTPPTSRGPIAGGSPAQTAHRPASRPGRSGPGPPASPYRTRSAPHTPHPPPHRTTPQPPHTPRINTATSRRTRHTPSPTRTGHSPHPGAAGRRHPRPPAGRHARGVPGGPDDRPGDVAAHTGEPGTARRLHPRGQGPPPRHRGGRDPGPGQGQGLSREALRTRPAERRTTLPLQQPGRDRPPSLGTGRER
ncbi:hypothetical protein SUDANB178_07462 [Streptomyces sp. enrichment culture]